jgi:hypothetical protein
MNQLWLITVPNGSEGPDSTRAALVHGISSDHKVHRFETPNTLSIGTLDTLIALSDELNKFNTQVEVSFGVLGPETSGRTSLPKSITYFYLSHTQNVVRKVERQYIDVMASRKLSQNVSRADESKLQIGSLSVDAFLTGFVWDNARYPTMGKPLTELVSSIQVMAAKVDEELKKVSTTYQEKQLTIATLLRKKNINISTSDFEDFIEPAMHAKFNIIPNEQDGTIVTMMVIVPKALETGKRIVQ